MKSFELFKIGLRFVFNICYSYKSTRIILITAFSESVKNDICPEANDELIECISSTVDQALADYYKDCLAYIEEIFANGYNDLKVLLGITH